LLEDVRLTDGPRWMHRLLRVRGVCGEERRLAAGVG
jgi:hypothetical protein